MRLVACVATVVIGLSVFCVSGCADKEKAPSEETSVTLSVDMPRVQTLQFLKQSASTLKLSDVRNENDDTIVVSNSIGVSLHGNVQISNLGIGIYLEGKNTFIKVSIVN